jgi:hypothetical protein
MCDRHPHEVRTTHRKVDCDRGPGARTDHDGGLGRKDSRIAAASAVCVEIERGGSPPDLV